MEKLYIYLETNYVLQVSTSYAFLIIILCAFTHPPPPPPPSPFPPLSSSITALF